MKKIISILILVVLIGILLCGCGVKTTTYPDGREKMLSKQFTVIKKTHLFGDENCYYIYDNNTKIMYLYTHGGYHATMCPYYININGEPTIAIYGVNYEYQEQNY